MKPFVLFLFVAIGVILATVADVFLKKSNLEHAPYLAVGIFLYAIGALPIAAAFRMTDFSMVFFVFEGVAILLGLALGVILFKEHLSLLKVAAFLSASLALMFSYLASR